MLAILTLGHMTLLAFAFREWLPEHDNLQDILLKSRRLLGSSKVIVTTVTMFAVLLWIFVIGALLASVRSWGIPGPMHDRLKYCAGLVRDVFLVPHITINALTDSKEKTLSSYFYVGISVIRQLPRTHDIHRARLYYPSKQFLDYDMINVPEEHGLFYKSITREIVVSLGIIVLVVIMHCPKRSGGRCVIPERFRNQERIADEELGLM